MKPLGEGVNTVGGGRERVVGAFQGRGPGVSGERVKPENHVQVR